MAGTIKIDTAKAVELAKEISIEKRKMAEAFDEAKAAITELCDFWESRVSVKTQAAFNEVANKNAEALYNHLDNTQLSFAGTENMAISMLPERKLLRQNLKMR